MNARLEQRPDQGRFWIGAGMNLSDEAMKLVTGDFPVRTYSPAIKELVAAGLCFGLGGCCWLLSEDGEKFRHNARWGHLFPC